MGILNRTRWCGRWGRHPGLPGRRSGTPLGAGERGRCESTPDLPTALARITDPLRSGVVSHADLYGILGVSSTASDQDIRAAFRSRAKQAHPDHGGSDDEMVKLAEAYETLSDPTTRAEYDHSVALQDADWTHPAERSRTRPGAARANPADIERLLKQMDEMRREAESILTNGGLCAGLTKDGWPCMNAPARGRKHCHHHQPSSNRTEARRCQGTSRSGTRCTSAALPGDDLCLRCLRQQPDPTSLSSDPTVAANGLPAARGHTGRFLVVLAVLIGAALLLISATGWTGSPLPAMLTATLLTIALVITAKLATNWLMKNR